MAEKSGPTTRSGGVASKLFDKRKPEEKWVPAYTKEEVQKLNRQELRDLCKKLGVLQTGSDQDLRDRLMAKFEEDTTSAEVATGSSLTGSPTVAQFLNEGVPPAAPPGMPSVAPLPGFQPGGPLGAWQQPDANAGLPDDTWADVARGDFLLYALHGFADEASDYEIYQCVRGLFHEFLPEYPFEVLGTSMGHVGFRIAQAQHEQATQAMQDKAGNFQFKGKSLSVISVETVHAGRFCVPVADMAIDGFEDDASSEVSEAPEVMEAVTMQALMQQLNTMEKRIKHSAKKTREQTRVMIAEAVDPVKNVVSDVQGHVMELQRSAVIQDDRIGIIESQLAKLSVGGPKFNANDVAHLRVSFKGFTHNDLEDRKATIQKFMDEHFKGAESFSCIETRMVGPSNDKKTSSESYVQLFSIQSRDRVLKAIEDGKYAQDLKSSKGTKLKVCRYKTDWQRGRDWAVVKAEEMVREKLEKNKSKAKVAYKQTKDDRKIFVNDEVAFLQRRSDAHGSFQSSFADLKLP